MSETTYTANELRLFAKMIEDVGLPGEDWRNLAAKGLRQEAFTATSLHDARNTLTEITGLSLVLRREGPEPEDLQELSNALAAAVRMAHEALSRIVP